MKNEKNSKNFFVSQKSQSGFLGCPACQTENLVEVDDILNELDGYTFIVKGRRCPGCGEEFITEPEGQRMIQVARRLGVWGHPLRLHRKLSQSARGTILRIPTDIEKSLGLKGTEEVLISKIGDKKILLEVA